MLSQIDHYPLEMEVHNRQSRFMAEAAHQRLVEDCKQTRQSVVSSEKSPRQLIGETLLKIGDWLTRTPGLKEA